MGDAGDVPGRIGLLRHVPHTLLSAHVQGKGGEGKGKGRGRGEGEWRGGEGRGRIPCNY